MLLGCVCVALCNVSTVTLHCVSGYSCKLVSHGMSLIIVNEDSLDVSTYCVFMYVCVCVLVSVLRLSLEDAGCGQVREVCVFVLVQVKVIKVSGVIIENMMKA